MDQFWLFSNVSYYAHGGFNDFIGAFATLEAAVMAGKKELEGEYNWYQVVDITKREVVASEGEPYH